MMPTLATKPKPSSVLFVEIFHVACAASRYCICLAKLPLPLPPSLIPLKPKTWFSKEFGGSQIENSVLTSNEKTLPCFPVTVNVFSSIDIDSASISASADAETFVYDASWDGDEVVGSDGNVTISGFNLSSDKIVILSFSTLILTLACSKQEIIVFK